MSRYDRAFCSGKRWAQLEAAAAGRLDPGPPEVEEPPAPVLCYLCDPRRCLFCRHPNQHTRTRSGRPARGTQAVTVLITPRPGAGTLSDAASKLNSLTTWNAVSATSSNTKAVTASAIGGVPASKRYGGGANVEPVIRTISIISPPPRNGGSSASRS